MPRAAGFRFHRAELPDLPAPSSPPTPRPCRETRWRRNRVRPPSARIRQNSAVSWSSVLVAPQQKPDQESDAHRDQQRLAGIRPDIGTHLIGDGAEVDVFHLFAHAVVAVAHRARRRLVLLADELARTAETARALLAAVRART